VVLNWIVFGLIIFGFAIVYNPLGSSKYRKPRENGPTDTTLHKKVSKMWIKRFRWVFCCLRKDEYGQEAFMQVASLLSALFRGTDLVPSDIMAGAILLRVRQKRETREMRRIRMLNPDDGPRYFTEMNRLFSSSPSWMTIVNARHMLRFALASYGWPMVCYLKCCSGCFKLLKNATCCGCCRRQNEFVNDDNCCLCHFGAVRDISKLREEGIVHLNMKNSIYELPFCILLDHKTKQIVISIRGSLSFRDVFTDLTADASEFEAYGFPSNSFAHRGMSISTEILLQRLQEGNLLDRVCNTYADYSLTLTGHSLGGGVSILVGAKLREKFPNLKVYAFATPAGLLSREAARITESFAFTVGVGDDFVMRLCVESVENIRINVIETLKACKLPKVSLTFIKSN
jgi:sn1-specific diacylglycerol lipase